MIKRKKGKRSERKQTPIYRVSLIGVSPDRRRSNDLEECRDSWERSRSKPNSRVLRRSRLAATHENSSIRILWDSVLETKSQANRADMCKDTNSAIHCRCCKQSNWVVETRSAMRTCKRCNHRYEGYPALSRVDNKSQICSECGVEEAMDNFLTGTIVPKEDWPLVD